MISGGHSIQLRPLTSISSSSRDPFPFHFESPLKQDRHDPQHGQKKYGVSSSHCFIRFIGIGRISRAIISPDSIVIRSPSTQDITVCGYILRNGVYFTIIS